MPSLTRASDYEAFSMLVIAAQTAALDPLIVTCASTNKVALLGLE
jgi:hypothetical protein